MRAVVGIAAVLSGVLLTTSGCSAGGSDVQWDKYPPDLKVIIDDYAAARDCDGLSRTFVTWAHARRAGGTADVMGYIHVRMWASGCYYQ